MRVKIAILITLAFLVLGAITVQGKSNAYISLNEPVPFPENM
ncbi:MAG: hypothetical protein NZ811_04105 [Gammaproteobacteria bacterium]|nr:hypothetical protein [Gammaproteobacteria bacterium]